jgi:hypothetical protein
MEKTHCKKPTQELIDGKCKEKCKENQTRNITTGRCILIKNANKTVKKASNPKSQTPPKNKSIKCKKPTQEIIDGKCKEKCKENQTRNSATGRCVLNKTVKNKPVKTPIQPPTKNTESIKINDNEIIIPVFKEKEKASIKEIKNYFDYMDEMQNIGKKYEKKGINYMGNSLTYGSLILYLFKKYNTKCLMIEKQGKLFKPFSFLLYESPTTKEQNDNTLLKIMKQLLNCIKKNKNDENFITIIPINFNVTKNNGHANMLIYRNSTATLEHFEPHGQFFYSQLFNANAIYEKLNFKKMVYNMNLYNEKKNNIYSDKIFNFVESSRVCPKSFGLQSLENQNVSPKNIKKNEGGGFCIMWNIFFAELLLLNPTIPSSILLGNILNWMEEKKQTNSLFVRNIIRGYIHIVLNETKLEIYKDFYLNPTLYFKRFGKYNDKNKPKSSIIENISIDIKSNLVQNP